jgi:hypothetical protein
MMFRKQTFQTVVAAFLLALCLVSVSTASARPYTREHPLVYEDAWDLWPYVYLNDKGQPEGFNIDMLQEALQYIADRYIASKFHINELKYYNIAFDNSEGEESNSIVSINRNLKLSPRPHYKDNKEAAEDENVMKTFIKINK